MRAYPPPAERFWARVAKSENGCWLWTGALSPEGYGRMRVGKKKWWVHRFAHVLLVGPIPAGYEVDHLCNRPACVNPAHLEAVTKRENLRRQGERRTHCHRGHELTPENTRHEQGGRKCRTCIRATSRARHAARRAVEVTA